MCIRDSYTVVSLPTHGTLALGGVAVTAGQVLTPTQAASLTYCLLYTSDAADDDG
nr:hypothetical protein [Flavobacterium sp. ASV13]